MAPAAGPGSRFVAVPAESIRDALSTAGFSLLPGPDSQEEVWELRHHHHRDFAVRVYTSIPRGSRGVRDCGEDAIRVAGVRYYAWHGGRRARGCADCGRSPEATVDAEDRVVPCSDGKPAHRILVDFSEHGYRAHGISRDARVYRTGTVEGVLERLLERARSAYARINETLKGGDHG